MEFLEDHAKSYRLTQVVEQAIVSGDADALARALSAVTDEWVTALMDGFQPQEGIGGVYSSRSVASLCMEHARPELFVLALDAGARGMQVKDTTEAWLDILCTARLRGYHQTSSLDEAVQYSVAGARPLALAVVAAARTHAAESTWAHGMALDMLEKTRAALLAAPADAR